MAESFRLGATTSKPLGINHTTEGLIKLLMYGDYVKARAYSSNASVQSVITEDLHNYPYKKKESFQGPRRGDVAWNSTTKIFKNENLSCSYSVL